MNKLVVINHEPLTDYTKSLWMLDELPIRGVAVEYWDVSNLCNKNVKSSFIINHKSLYVICNYRDFLSQIKRVNREETLFADAFPVNWKNVVLRALLRYYSCRLIRIQQYFYNNKMMKQKSSSMKLRDFILKLSSWFLMKTTKLLKLQEYVKIFSPFDIGLGEYSKLNLPDYETYKRNEDRIRNDGYIVFIDQYIPIHPDFYILYNYEFSDPVVNEYRRKMIALFDSLEKRYKKEVVILAHPKANYVGYEFGNRKIIHGDTCVNLLESSMVIFHYSNAISFAILSNKPVICCNLNLFNDINPICYNKISNNANLLGIKVYNLDIDNIDNIYPETVPVNNRDNYIYSSLTSKETENYLNCDIIARFLTSNQ